MSRLGMRLVRHMMAIIMEEDDITDSVTETADGVGVVRMVLTFEI